MHASLSVFSSSSRPSFGVLSPLATSQLLFSSLPSDTLRHHRCVRSSLKQVRKFFSPCDSISCGRFAGQQGRYRTHNLHPGLINNALFSIKRACSKTRSTHSSGLLALFLRSNKTAQAFRVIVPVRSKWSGSAYIRVNTRVTFNALSLLPNGHLYCKPEIVNKAWNILHFAISRFIAIL